jgi:pantothenate kinase-related protein Tda10
MRKQKKIKDMSLDQQIKIYEDRINQLEQMKRTLITKTGNLPGENDFDLSGNYLSRINVDLDENYQHITILKIRKMMGF